MQATTAAGATNMYYPGVAGQQQQPIYAQPNGLPQYLPQYDQAAYHQPDSFNNPQVNTTSSSKVDCRFNSSLFPCSCLILKLN